MVLELLENELNKQDLKIEFIKSNGESRVMHCTRKKELIGDEIYENYINPKTPRKKSTSMIPAYDLEIKEWRGFTVNNVIKVDGIPILKYIESCKENK